MMAHSSGAAASARPGGLDARRSGAPAGWGASPVPEALDGAITAIAAAGCQTPRLDAEVLLAHVLGVPRERLISGTRPRTSQGAVEVSRAGSPPGELHLAGPAVRAFQDAVRRRAVEREPVAYIVGRRAFRRLELGVDPRALVPRPESELLVEVALGLTRRASVLDVGTGCGAVALALKDERPDLKLTGSDISAGALELARANGRRLGLEVSWRHADLLAGVPDDFQAVLANLPYVCERERASLAPEILRHEPSQALFAGPDGLGAIRALLAALRARGRVSFLALEVGSGQAPAVAEMTRAAGFAAVRCERDLAGIERVVVGERAPR